jgi:hypothetical protein
MRHINSAKAVQISLMDHLHNGLRIIHNNNRMHRPTHGGQMGVKAQITAIPNIAAATQYKK